MKYTLILQDIKHEISIEIQNLDFDLLHKISEPETIDFIFNSKFYMYGKYDRISIAGYNFMILKSTKKNVVMINI